MIARSFICFLLTLSLSAHVFAFESITQADRHFLNKEWAKGRTVLMDNLVKSPPIGNDEKAAIYNKLSEFYETKTGNYKEALLFLKKVGRLKLGENHPEQVKSNETLKRILTLQKDYRDQFKALNSVIFDQTDVTENLLQIKVLKALIRDNPEFPELGSAYYFLGSKYLAIEKYFNAYKSLKKAREIVPALDFKHPVQSKLESSVSKFNIWLVTSFIWVWFGLIPIAAIFFIIKTKPWKFVGSFHVKATIGAFLISFVLIAALHWAAVKMLPESTDLVFQKPIFVYNMLGNPESKVLWPMFVYSSLAIFLSIPFIIFTSGSRLKWTMITTQSLCVGLIFMSCIFVFYFRYCEDASHFSPSKGANLPYLKGSIMFDTSDMIPYVLTNPKLYQNLALSNIDEVEFIQWVEEQKKIINKEKAGKETK